MRLAATELELETATTEVARQVTELARQATNSEGLIHLNARLKQENWELIERVKEMDEAGKIRDLGLAAAMKESSDAYLLTLDIMRKNKDKEKADALKERDAQSDQEEAQWRKRQRETAEQSRAMLRQKDLSHEAMLATKEDEWIEERAGLLNAQHDLKSKLCLSSGVRVCWGAARMMWKERRRRRKDAH